MRVLRIALALCLGVALLGRGYGQQRLYDPDPLCVVVFGDAEASDAPAAGEGFARSLEGFLDARGAPAVVQSALRSGESTSAALERFETDVLAREPDVVVWRFGWQDGTPADPPGEDPAQSVRLALAQLEQRGIQALMITAPARTDEQPGARLAGWQDELRKLASLSAAALLDAQNLLLTGSVDDFRNSKPARLSERGQAQLARLVAEHITRLGVTPRTLPLRRSVQTLDVLRSGEPTQALRNAAGESLEQSAQVLDTALVLGSGAWELVLSRRTGAELGLELSRAGRLDFSDSTLTLSGDLFGGGERVLPLAASDRNVVLRRRSPRRMELLVEGHLIYQTLWAAPLGTLRLTGPRSGCDALRLSGTYSSIQTTAPFGPVTETARLTFDELDPKASPAPAAREGPIEAGSDVTPPPGTVATGRPRHWLSFRVGGPGAAIQISESYDDGQNFSRPRTLLREPGFAFDHPVAVRAGERILLFLCDSARGVIHLCESSNRGRSFTAPKPIGGDLAGQRLDLAITQTGDLLACGYGASEAVLWLGSPDQLRLGQPGRLRVAFEGPHPPDQLIPNPDGSFALLRAAGPDAADGEPEHLSFHPEDLEALVRARLAE